MGFCRADKSPCCVESSWYVTRHYGVIYKVMKGRSREMVRSIVEGNEIQWAGVRIVGQDEFKESSLQIRKKHMLKSIGVQSRNGVGG